MRQYKTNELIFTRDHISTKVFFFLLIEPEIIGSFAASDFRENFVRIAQKYEYREIIELSRFPWL